MKWKLQIAGLYNYFRNISNFWKDYCQCNVNDYLKNETKTIKKNMTSVNNLILNQKFKVDFLFWLNKIYE